MKQWLVILSVLFAVTVAGKAEATNLYIVQRNTYTPEIKALASSPQPNQQLTEPPTTVAMKFTIAVDPTKSTLEVYDPYNKKIATSPVTASGTGMSVMLPKLPQGYSGTYRIEWKAVCQCTTPVSANGKFFFSIQ